MRNGRAKKRNALTEPASREVQQRGRSVKVKVELA
jgi:hypothetical protein